MSDDRKRVEELTLTEPGDAVSSLSIADHMRKILQSIGEDPNRDGLRRTPERFEKAFRFLTSGYQQDPEKLLNGAMFSVCYDQMVLVKDIICREMQRRLYTRQESGRSIENSTPGEYVRAPAADPGASDESNRQRDPGENCTPRSGCGHRRAPSLHGDARGRKGKLANGDQRDAGLIQGQSQDARGISVLDPRK